MQTQISQYAMAAEMDIDMDTQDFQQQHNHLFDDDKLESSFSFNYSLQDILEGNVPDFLKNNNGWVNVNGNGTNIEPCRDIETMDITLADLCDNSKKDTSQKADIVNKHQGLTPKLVPILPKLNTADLNKNSSNIDQANSHLGTGLFSPNSYLPTNSLPSPTFSEIQKAHQVPLHKTFSISSDESDDESVTTTNDDAPKRVTSVSSISSAHTIIPDNEDKKTQRSNIAKQSRQRANHVFELLKKTAEIPTLPKGKVDKTTVMLQVVGYISELKRQMTQQLKNEQEKVAKRNAEIELLNNRNKALQQEATAWRQKYFECSDASQSAMSSVISAPTQVPTPPSKSDEALPSFQQQQEGKKLLNLKYIPTDNRTSTGQLLPFAWEESCTVNGRKFYVNHLLRTTQWTSPLDAPYVNLDMSFNQTSATAPYKNLNAMPPPRTFSNPSLSSSTSSINTLKPAPLQRTSSAKEVQSISMQRPPKVSIQPRPIQPTNRLPDGWEEAIDRQGRTYYINHEQKMTTWFKPPS